MDQISWFFTFTVSGQKIKIVHIIVACSVNTHDADIWRTLNQANSSWERESFKATMTATVTGGTVFSVYNHARPGFDIDKLITGGTRSAINRKHFAAVRVLAECTRSQ